jgi:hypothetical protein
MHHFTKTGSGQTYGKHSKTEWRFLRELKGLAAKKLFYWSSRFSSYSSAGAFAR